MLTHQASCRASASDVLGFVDVTDQIQDEVAESAVRAGRVTIVRQDSGCALVVNEQESGLHADVRATMDRLGARRDGLTAPVGSPSLVLPIVDGRIHLGTWQRILLLELEEPRDRSLLVQVVGES